MSPKKPISVQIAKDYDKLSKHDADPKKAGKKRVKDLAKKKRQSSKSKRQIQ